MGNFQEKKKTTVWKLILWIFWGNLAKVWAMFFRRLCPGGGVSVCREKIKCPDEEKGQIC